ncbi:MAG: hypothetical protein MSC31_18410 [Solirubrobacteraceae bacterium MAG38_C4-C5]|nr:hypothetical protein [Candidatus Siliceabacter maunaloa]
MEWLLLLLLLLLVPVVVLMLAVKLLTVAHLPSAVRRFREDWKRSGWPVHLMFLVASGFGIALVVAIEAGGGRLVAYALLAFLAVPVVSGVALPIVLLAQHWWRSRHG